VSVWEVQYTEELIPNIYEFVVRICVGPYREELILNISVFCEGLGRAI